MLEIICALTLQGAAMERGMAEVLALHRAPSINDSFARLTPDSKLTFESHAWLITLDPATGQHPLSCLNHSVSTSRRQIPLMSLT